MKAKVLAGALAAILLTASVVVGFFQNAAFIAQKSNHRGRRHYLSHVELSARTLEYDDLSSILQTAKSEMSVSTANSATSSVESAASSAASAADTVTSAATSAANIASSVVTPVGDKAPTFADYVKTSIDGTAPRPSGNVDWSSTKSGLSLLKDNTIRLTGQDPGAVPDIQLPDIRAGYNKIAEGMPKVSLKDVDFKSSLDNIPKFDVASIQQFFEHLPPAAKTWAALAAGGTILLFGAANSKPKVKAASSEDIDSTSAKIGGLTDELGTLQARMKTLEATGFDLDNQLKEAGKKLTEKELDIGKARLQAADASLSLNREINMLKQKLQENDGKVKSLDAELNKARDECTNLVQELEKGKKDQEKKVAGEAAKIEKLKKEAEAAAVAAKKKEAEEARKMTLEAAKKADEEAKKKKAEVAAKKATKPAPKKKAVPKKKAAPKKAAPKKTVTKAKSEELPTADTVAPKKAAAPMKKAAKKTVAKSKELPTSDDATPFFTQELPKKAAPKKKAAAKKKAAGNDLTALSKSALSRTTVKVLVGFLDSKGISTVDDNGKTKKKADLIEAVNSL